MLEESKLPKLPSTRVLDSYGAFMQRTDASEQGDAQLREELRNCWFRLNRILPFTDRMFLQINAICEANKIIDSMQRHDEELDDEAMAKIHAIHFLRQTPNAVFSTSQQLKHINTSAIQAVSTMQGILRGKKKVLLSDRLARLQKETAELEALFQEESAEQRKLPRKPYLLRQAIFTELAISLDAMLSELTPLRQLLKNSNYALAEQVRAHEATLFSWRRKVKKYRDNPSERQSSSLQKAQQELGDLCYSLAAMKDRCFHDCKEFGYSFFDRGGKR